MGHRSMLGNWPLVWSTWRRSQNVQHIRQGSPRCLTLLSLLPYRMSSNCTAGQSLLSAIVDFPCLLVIWSTTARWYLINCIFLLSWAVAKIQQDLGPIANFHRPTRHKTRLQTVDGRIASCCSRSNTRHKLYSCQFLTKSGHMIIMRIN